MGGSGGRPGGPATDPTAASVELVSLEEECSGGGGVLASDLPGPRVGAAAAAADGVIIMCGGTDGQVDDLDDCIAKNLTASSSSEWAHHSYLNERRMSGAAVRVRNTLFMSGGSLEARGIEYLDPSGGAYTWRYGPSLPDGVRSLYGHCSLPWGADGLLLIGGVYTTSQIIVSRDVLLYNMTTDQWTVWPSLQTRRRNLACAWIGDGSYILVAGGDNDNVDTEVSHTAEMLEVGGGGPWRSVGRLATGRKGGQLAVLHGGRTVIAGGYSPEAGTFLDSLEEFSLETEEWRLVVEPRLQLARGAYAFLTVPDTYCQPVKNSSTY